MANSAKSSAWRARYGRQLAALAACVVIALLAISVIAQLTAARIARNERAWLEARINAMVPHELFDNDLLLDKIQVRAPESLGTRNPESVYRARLKGVPTAAIINSVAPDGYGGPIELLVAINYAGEVLGVQVLSHHETPGMGNDFELPGNTWLNAFRGHSLHAPETPGWNVRKDGGQFEQFTSATISPRAIIQAVQHTLDYYQNNRAQLFQASPN